MGLEIPSPGPTELAQRCARALGGSREENVAAVGGRIRGTEGRGYSHSALATGRAPERRTTTDGVGIPPRPTRRTWWP